MWEALIEVAADFPVFSLQMLCEEDGDDRGSRNQNFKPDTKDWETWGSWHLCRP